MRGMRSKVEVLSQDEIELIHKESLRILENVGVSVPSDEYLDACEKAGAKVERSTSTVKIPSKLMEILMLEHIKADSLSQESDDGRVKPLTGGISTQIFMYDYKTQTRRYGVLDDIKKGIALSEHLDNIPAAGAVVVPHDVPHNMTDIISYQTLYSYSSKPGATYILSPVSAKYIIEMAKLMGKELSYGLKVISPLQFRKESLEMSLIFARQGYNLSVGPMVVGGATGPVTVAGILTLQNAENLAGIFLIYALTGKLCRSYSGYCHSMDLRTTLCSFGSPNQTFFGIAAAQIARFYGLRPGSNSGITDALLPDFQAGFEKAVSIAFSCLAGSMGIGAQGIAGADQGMSMEQLVIDNEWLSFYNYIINGFEVSMETIGTDVISSVGIGGVFTAEEHTIRHMRSSYWESRIFGRLGYDALQSRGFTGILDRAHDFVKDAIARSYPKEPVIPQSRHDELNYLVKCAEEEMKR